MARTRAFDVDEAVRSAMELFWLRGYEATSVRDLTDFLGIGSGSLYAAFGDKEGLYQRALELYRDTCASAALRDLSQGTSARAAVKTLLLERLRVAVTDGGRGCLMVNAVCERVPKDAATQRMVRDVQEVSQKTLAEVIGAGIATGEIRADRDPDTLADYFITFLNGLLVASKMTPDVRELTPMVELALSTLD